MSEAVAAQGIERYRALLRVPYARPLFLWALLARMPMGMVPLALILLVREEGGSYGAAGAVVGTHFVATAVGAPVAGRLIDRRGHAHVLRPRAVVYPALLLVLCGLALVDAPIVAFGACGVAAGALTPPIGASLRSLWPRLLADPSLRAAAYALEASLQEVYFVVGPLLVAIVAGLASPVAALALAAAAAGVGTTAFVSTRPVQTAGPSDAQVRGFLGALASPGVRTILLIVLCLGLGFGGVEVGIPAFAEEHGARELAGIPLACYAAGSLVGGLVAGARATGGMRRQLWLASVALVVGLTLPLFATSLPALAILMFAAGLPIAPLVMAAYGLVDKVARPGTAAEAFAWITTAIGCGFAVGSSVGGALIDAHGVRASFALGCAGAALAAVLALAGRGLDGEAAGQSQRADQLT